MILICFVPNQEAINARIGLKDIDNFKWGTTTKEGDLLSHEVVTNGKGDGISSAVTCLNANNKNDKIVL